MKISHYTTLAELTKSQTAMRLGIKNEPNAEQIENLKKVCTAIFDKVRAHFGVPILISSGFRSAELNKAIGGSKTSQHTLGLALDIDADVLGGVTNKQIFNYIKDNLQFDQLIWEMGNDNNPDWVHVSLVEHKNRKEILKATIQKGKTVYELYH